MADERAEVVALGGRQRLVGEDLGDEAQLGVGRRKAVGERRRVAGGDEERVGLGRRQVERAGEREREVAGRVALAALEVVDRRGRGAGLSGERVLGEPASAAQRAEERREAGRRGPGGRRVGYLSGVGRVGASRGGGPRGRGFGHSAPPALGRVRGAGA